MSASWTIEAESVIEGYICAVATPIAALSAWSEGLGGQDVRPLADELRGKAHRQLVGKRELVDVEIGR